MKLLPRCVMTLTLMTFILSDLCIAWSILCGTSTNPDNRPAVRQKRWLPDLDFRTGSDSYPSNYKGSIGHHGNDFYQSIFKKLDQLKKTTDEGMNQMIGDSLVKYSIMCLLHNSHSCPKADWLRRQQHTDDDDWLKFAIEIATNEDQDNTNHLDLKSEIKKSFMKYQKELSKRVPMISVDQSLHAIDRGQQESSIGDRQESSLSRLDTIGR